ncbi:hypothetical protein [Edwardsiella piscicida]|uniref:hypothetical protein n=1 Tax=Edwardsiella piscicida TaxID=1263550 RepID=UPI0010A5CC9E|nr:hypothetical protein [Edwardsiella piscicida]UCQ21033.1 hypothetical protein DCE66_16705 [Edwardsiella piscicida]
MFIPDNLDEDVYTDCGWRYIWHNDYLKPNIYLQDAIDDLSSGSERRNLNNAVRNAKSALHMRVDILCRSFCGDEYFQKNLRNFPQKMDFLEKIGIVRPRIIDKINKIRNEIEHEYRDATLEEAEDFIDIVLLFMEATRYLNTRFPCDADFHILEISDEIYLRKIECNWKNGELIFYYSKQKSLRLDNMETYSIKVGDYRYAQWVKFILEHCD